MAGIWGESWGANFWGQIFQPLALRVANGRRCKPEDDLTYELIESNYGKHFANNIPNEKASSWSGTSSV